MKSYLISFICVAVLTTLALAACSNAPAATPSTIPSASPAPTEVAASPLPVQSSTPTATPAPLLTPTLVLPVLAGTPIPIPQEPITADNLDQIRPLAMWGRGEIHQIAYSPDGKFLVIGSTAGLWLHDAQSLELVHFILTNSEILAMGFSGDGLSLMAQVGGNTIKRWDTGSWSEEGSWPVGVRELKEVVFSPDGRTLVSALEDGQVGLWEIESGRLLKTFGIESDPLYFINALALSADGKLLASEGAGHTIRLWEVETGQLLRILPGHSETGTNVVNLLFSPDDSLLVSAAANEIIRLWDVETGSQQRELKGGINLAFSPDGRFLAAGVSNQTISVWTVANGQLQQSLSYPLQISGLAFAPDGTVLASGGETGLGLWVAETGEPIGTITGYQAGYEDIWRLVIPSGSDGTALIWHYEDQQLDLLDVRTGQVYLN